MSRCAIFLGVFSSEPSDWFAGEEIEYYISEQDENGEKTGEKHLLQREEAMDAWPETGVELLNRMIMQPDRGQPGSE